MDTPPSMLSAVWERVAEFLVANADVLSPGAEAVKIAGAFASFFALWKLRQIEQRYLFKATIPGLIANLDASLTKLGVGMNDLQAAAAAVNEALYQLLADAKSVRQRGGADVKAAADVLIAHLETAGLHTRFWHRHVALKLEKDILLRVYGSGNGLIRSLQNELSDRTWSSK
jgi:hypothetical protein